MKTIFAVLASASILAAPLAAAAQDHLGFQGRSDRGGQPAAAPANPAPAAQAPGGGFSRGRGGQGAQPAPQAAPQQRGFGGQDRGRDFAGRGPDRGQDRGGDRAFDRRGDDRRGFAQRDYGYRGQSYGRGYDRGFRWSVGAYLPRAYWNTYVDPYAYGLGRAPWGYHWVVVEGEALLIQDGTGAIVQVLPL